LLINLTIIVTFLVYLNLLSAILGLGLYAKLRPTQKSYKYLFAYIFYSIISDLIFSKLSIKYLESEIYSFRLYTIVEYTLLTLAIKEHIKSQMILKFIYTFSFLFYCLAFFDSILGKISQFDSLPAGFESILLLVYSLFFIYEKVINNTLNFNGFTWVVIGLIIAFSGTFFLFILTQKNFENQVFIITYGYIVAIFNIIKFTFLSIGIYTENKKMISINHNSLIKI
jgi:hypothetical protein